MTIADTGTKLLAEIEDKRGKLKIKTAEATAGFDKLNEEFGTFIQNYNEPKADFQLDTMKTNSTRLTLSIDLTVENFIEINKLNGTDTNNDKITLLESHKGKIQEIVLREESKASKALEFVLGKWYYKQNNHNKGQLHGYYGPF